MKTSVTKTFEIIFTVEAHWNEEGGMGSDQYGGECAELAQALSLYEIALTCRPNTDWRIVGTVKILTK